MAATSTSVPELLEALRQARADVAGHKRAIKVHRSQLGAAAARLLELEAECRRRGIAVIHSQPEGVAEDSHGRQKHSRSHH